ncbi:unnamed protein product [Protopolystoma xenopodis]|uniref:Uncharacterized protein n=1 Tax=Protopolystoma xenopodis TaxID=117903 RepID=A0A3S5B5R7_9PLAT|nr:unnamed protein product [Protopolystoma xenopodis]
MQLGGPGQGPVPVRVETPSSSARALVLSGWIGAAVSGGLTVCRIGLRRFTCAAPSAAAVGKSILVVLACYLADGYQGSSSTEPSVAPFTASPWPLAPRLGRHRTIRRRLSGHDFRFK